MTAANRRADNARDEPVFAFAAVLVAALGCAPAAIPCTGAGDCPAGSACDDGACEDDGAVDPAAPFVPSVEHVGQRREHRRAIVVPAAHVHGTLAGFPLLVRIDHDDAPRSIAHGGFALRDDGADLRFLADGSDAPLPREIERYDPATGALAAWVRVPRLDAKHDTRLTLVWGARTTSSPPAAAVWSSSYRAVWHLDDNPDAQAFRDSSGRGNAGVPHGLDGGAAVAGRVGGGVAIHDADQAIEIDSDDLDFTGSVTLEAWARIDDVSTRLQQLFHRGDDKEDVLALVAEAGEPPGTAGFIAGRQELLALVPGFEPGSWHFYTAVFDGAAHTEALYVDGTLLALAATDLAETPGGGVSFLGNDHEGDPAPGGGARNLVGVLDEVRVADRALPSGWIETAYANVRDPDGFVIMGDDEAGP